MLCLHRKTSLKFFTALLSRRWRWWKKAWQRLDSHTNDRNGFFAHRIHLFSFLFFFYCLMNTHRIFPFFISLLSPLRPIISSEKGTFTLFFFLVRAKLMLTSDSSWQACVWAAEEKTSLTRRHFWLRFFLWHKIQSPHPLSPLLG